MAESVLHGLGVGARRHGCQGGVPCDAGSVAGQRRAVAERPDSFGGVTESLYGTVRTVVI